MVQTLKFSQEDARVNHGCGSGDTAELMAFCPRCKTLETLCFAGDAMVQTRKFNQEDGRVYHDCGSGEPCLLLACSLNKEGSRR